MNRRLVLLVAVGCTLQVGIDALLRDFPRGVLGRIGFSCMALMALLVTWILVDYFGSTMSSRNSASTSEPPADAGASASVPSAGKPHSARNFFDFRSIEVEYLVLRLHSQLFGAVSPEILDNAEHDSDARANIEEIVSRLLDADSLPVDEDRSAITKRVVDEALDLGPVSSLLNDPTISDILVNSPTATYVERGGKLYRTEVTFSTREHLDRIILRLFSKAEKRTNDPPLLRGSLADGSRLAAVLSPVAVGSSFLSIRRFGRHSLTMDDLVAKGSLTAPMAALIKYCVLARLNILFSGGTGSGRSTVLNCVSKLIPSDEHIIAIGEVRLPGDNVVRLEPPEGQSAANNNVTLQTLIQQAIRMRPDRIILGDVAGPEASDIIQAINSGHDGSLICIHSNSPREALSRLEMMMHLAEPATDPRFLRREIGGAIDLIVQFQRFSDGTRRVTHVTECTGFERDQLLYRDIALFEKTGRTNSGRVTGQFRMTGIKPRFIDRFKQCGIVLPSTFFDPGITSIGSPDYDN